MLYLMFLLGVYDQATSQRVGSETLLKILVIRALSPMADAVGSLPALMSPLVMVLCTLLVVAGGTMLWLALRVYKLEGTLKTNSTLLDVLGIPQKLSKSPSAEGEGEESESEDEDHEDSPATRYRRYMDAEDMGHVSDPDERCRLHYDVEENSPRFQQQLDQMHALRVRLHRLEAEWDDETQLANDMDAMHNLEMQIIEVSVMLLR